MLSIEQTPIVVKAIINPMTQNFSEWFNKGLIMNKLICNVFATALFVSAFSATAATSSSSKVSKIMDENNDGMVTKVEYMAYHDRAYGKMKQSNGGVSNKVIDSGVSTGFYNNSMNDMPIGTTNGVSNNGSTSQDYDIPIVDGTNAGTNN